MMGCRGGQKCRQARRQSSHASALVQRSGTGRSAFIPAARPPARQRALPARLCRRSPNPPASSHRLSWARPHGTASRPAGWALCAGCSAGTGVGMRGVRGECGAGSERWAGGEQPGCGGRTGRSWAFHQPAPRSRRRRMRPRAAFQPAEARSLQKRKRDNKEKGAASEKGSPRPSQSCHKPQSAPPQTFRGSFLSRASPLTMDRSGFMTSSSACSAQGMPGALAMAALPLASARCVPCAPRAGPGMA